MKIEDAKKKWCPFARVVWTAGAGNRGAVEGQPLIPDQTKCVADRCMMWEPDLRPNQVASSLGDCGLKAPARG